MPRNDTTVVIRINGDDYEALKAYAQPLVDKPKDVIERMIAYYIQHHPIT